MGCCWVVGPSLTAVVEMNPGVIQDQVYFLHISSISPGRKAGICLSLFHIMDILILQLFLYVCKTIGSSLFNGRNRCNRTGYVL